MELTEDESIEKYGKHCTQCHLETLLPYEHDWSCVACGYKIIKRKHDLS